MTRSTTHTPTPDPVELEAESPSATDRSAALRLAQATALGVARGTGSIAKGGGRLLGRGYSAAKAGLARNTADGTVRTEDVAAASSGRRLRPILLVGAAVAVVAAGVAAWRLRRPEPAPVADRPPSLRDLDAPDQAN
ncbi:hypothetical protein [Rhodococcus gannanensis]|uniref:Cell wall synthesis protein CwsA n=1 Tax=Rhodococcus gannanensis TaxID=1960308 RepID=A0ABW4P308_9NOCA